MSYVFKIPKKIVTRTEAAVFILGLFLKVATPLQCHSNMQYNLYL